jgi:hypothetical protein
LVAPRGGIIDLLDEYEKSPTAERWEMVIRRAEANHKKLQAVYGMLQDLKWVLLFGERPDISNAIEQVVDAKNWDFYRYILNSHLVRKRQKRQRSRG